MAGTIRARFSKGVIKPLEKVDITDEREITVTIMELPAPSREDTFAACAGGWKGLIDAEKLIKDIYQDRLISTRKIPKL
jgi:predicted DNA-binding antitoxin AbrB/MazE fold protein